MIEDAKYVVLEGRLNDIIIIFPAYVIHAEVAAQFPAKVISAGHICFGIDENSKIKAVCYGESESLQVVADVKRDSAMANKMLRLG